ncbi:MAG: ribonuclease HII [Leifsonia sp.]
MTPVPTPTLAFERELFDAGHRFVIGCDEVGRGAIAGPVAVGMAVIEPAHDAIPDGLRDSKLLSEKRREVLAPIATAWVLHSSVGLASAAEVDEIGIIASLGLAGKRALAGLHASGARVLDSVVLLDGSHDWLSPALTTKLAVVTRVKADRDCGSVAAASVIAKVHRDRLMIEAHGLTPAYGWAGNKGYGSADHFAAIDANGPSALHRVSWLKTTLAPA